jgi:signal transduction histidine kinase
MHRRWLSKIVHSVFLKLLLVIIIAGLCINLVVGAFFYYLTKGYMQNMPFKKNWVQYMGYLVEEIGESPDIERARSLADKLSIAIAFETDDGIWYSTDLLPSVDSIALKKISQDPVAHWSRHEGRGLLLFESAGRRYMFDMMRPYSWQHFVEEKILLLIALLTCILLFGFLAIRWILKPLTWLNDGVRQVSSGNLDYRLPVQRLDEFGTLAEAFNSMTGRIREMLHARERLLLDVSHELRSPITRLKVALEFMPVSPVVHGMQADIHDMEAMVSEIVESQRLGSPYGRLNLESTDICALVRELVAERVNSIPAILFENEDCAITVMLDRTRMQTVLKNVVDNALKYSHAGCDPVRIAVFRDGSTITVQVRDAGQGIPSEDLQHVFEPFYRVDKSRSRRTGGYGLGLSICKTIMEAHGGSITVASEPGQGTTVKLLLPEAQPDR